MLCGFSTLRLGQGRGLLCYIEPGLGCGSGAASQDFLVKIAKREPKGRLYRPDNGTIGFWPWIFIRTVSHFIGLTMVPLDFDLEFLFVQSRILVRLDGPWPFNIQVPIPSVWRIRDVYPGSYFFPSLIRTVSIPDSGSSSKNLSILIPKKAKKWFLSSKKYDLGCSSRIPDPLLTFSHPGSRIQGSKRHPIPDPGSGSATLDTICFSGISP